MRHHLNEYVAVIQGSHLASDPNDWLVKKRFVTPSIRALDTNEVPANHQDRQPGAAKAAAQDRAAAEAVSAAPPAAAQAGVGGDHEMADAATVQAATAEAAAVVEELMGVATAAATGATADHEMTDATAQQDIQTSVEQFMRDILNDDQPAGVVESPAAEQQAPGVEAVMQQEADASKHSSRYRKDRDKDKDKEKLAIREGRVHKRSRDSQPEHQDRARGTKAPASPREASIIKRRRSRSPVQANDATMPDKRVSSPVRRGRTPTKRRPSASPGPRRRGDSAQRPAVRRSTDHAVVEVAAQFNHEPPRITSGPALSYERNSRPRGGRGGRAGSRDGRPLLDSRDVRPVANSPRVARAPSPRRALPVSPVTTPAVVVLPPSLMNLKISEDLGYLFKNELIELGLILTLLYATGGDASIKLDHNTFRSSLPPSLQRFPSPGALQGFLKKSMLQPMRGDAQGVWLEPGYIDIAWKHSYAQELTEAFRKKADRQLSGGTGKAVVLGIPLTEAEELMSDHLKLYTLVSVPAAVSPEDFICCCGSSMVSVNVVLVVVTCHVTVLLLQLLDCCVGGGAWQVSVTQGGR